MEYFKSRRSHFQLAYHQPHLPRLPTRQLVWHFRKYASWRGFKSKGTRPAGLGYQPVPLGNREKSSVGREAPLHRRLPPHSPPFPPPSPVGLIWIRNCFSHYFPHRLNRSWQHVWGKRNKKGYRQEREKNLSTGKRGLFETFDQLWRSAWRARGWKWSLSGRLFWWEQQWWQMGQLNHCGKSVLDGWLWISGGHRVAVPMSASCQRNLAYRALKSPQRRDQTLRGGGGVSVILENDRKVSGASPKRTSRTSSNSPPPQWDKRVPKSPFKP